MAWYDGLMSGLSNAWESNPWGVIGSGLAAGSAGLGLGSNIFGAIRQMDQQRQMDRVNKSIMEANRRNTDIYGREQAGREEANRINLAQFQRDQAMRDQANQQNMARWQSDEALRQQANQLNLSGYQEQLQQTRAEAARRNAGLDQLRSLATSPINAGEFYKPMSDAESMSRRRAIQADMSGRGVPIDSAYATNLMSEQMAGTESQRYFQALQEAMRARGMQEQTLAGTIPGTPHWGSYAPQTGGGQYNPMVGGQFTPQAGGGFPTPTMPQWGQTQSYDPSGPFAYLYQTQKNRQPTRQGETGQATAGGPFGGRDESAYQTQRAQERNPAAWGMPQDDMGGQFPGFF